MDKKTIYERAFNLVSSNLKLNEFAGNVDSTIELDSIKLNQHLREVSQAIVKLTESIEIYPKYKSELNVHLSTLRSSAFKLETEYPEELHDSDLNLEEINGKLCLIYQSKINKE
jgi:hypothetical protein